MISQTLSAGAQTVGGSTAAESSRPHLGLSPARPMQQQPDQSSQLAPGLDPSTNSEADLDAINRDV